MKGRILNIVLVLVLAALPMAANAGWSEAQQVSNQPAPSQIEETPTPDVDFNSSPVMFIENVGQWDDGARFQVWGGPAGTMWLAEDAIWITVVEPGEASRQVGKGFDPMMSFEDQEAPAPRSGVNIKLSFVGANPQPRIETFDRLDTTVSYFYGNDPEQWRPDVPVWGGVRYVELYPGIDLELTNEDGRMVHRLATQPAADLAVVRLRVEGANTVAVDGDVLRLGTTAGEFMLPLLRVESMHGKGSHVELSGTEVYDVATPFVSATDNGQSIGGRVQSPAAALSALHYSTFLGGGATEGGYEDNVALAIDSTGAAFVAGETWSPDFPTTPGAFGISHHGGTSDAFVAKLSPAGNYLVYATYLGGSVGDTGRSIAVDGSGAAYVSGGTESSDFPVTTGAFDTTYNGAHDAFVAKLNATGTGLVYSTYIGGTSSETARAVAVDGTGAAYVAGETWSSDFPVTSGAFDTTFNGYYDAFVAKVNPSGDSLAYATFLGGSNGEDARALEVSPTGGTAYVVGYTRSLNFPTTPGAYDRTCNCGSNYNDAFVAKLSGTGSQLVYSTFLGGGGDDMGDGLAVDEAGAAYIVGRTRSSDFPTTPLAYDSTYNGGLDAFVVKLNTIGSALIYATFLGGSSDDCFSGSGGGCAVALDGLGSAYIAGRTRSSDFPVTLNAFDTSYNGGTDDTFIAKLDETGSGLTYSTFLGGSGSDRGRDIAVAEDGAAYVVGVTDSLGFPTTPGAFATILSGPSDAFVTKLASGLVAGPPVLLVHGWIGGPWNILDPSVWRYCRPRPEVYDANNPRHEEWNDIADDLLQEGYTVWVANLDSRPSSVPSLETNAVCLKRQVEQVANRSNQAILITHSMGGLVSRAYMENESLYRDTVKHLITLGTPHGGVNWTAIRRLLGLSQIAICEVQPAVCQFSTDGVVKVNARYHERAASTDYTLIGGTWNNSAARVLEKTEGPNDTVVGRNSATGRYWRNGIAVDDDNGVVVGRYQTVSNHGGYFSDSNSVECIKSRLGLGGDCDPFAESIEIDRTTEPILTDLTIDLTGSLNEGQTVNRTVAVDATGASVFMLTWMNGSLSFTLTDPSGLVITPAYAAANPAEVSYSSEDMTTETPPWASYTFTETVPGLWTLAIGATSAPPEGTNYMASVYMETDLQLDAGTDQSLYQIGDTATFTAALSSASGGVTGAVVETIIARSDGVTETVQLADQGNGNYHGTYTVPDAPSVLFAGVMATGTNGGFAFSRQANLVFSVASPYVSLTGQYNARTPDANGDGQFDSLLIDVGIAATRPTTITLSGSLVSAEVTRTITSVATAVIDVGTQVVTLDFPGRSIHRLRSNGPYTLTNVVLEDIGVGGVQADAANDAFVTAAYDYRQFGLRGDVDDSCEVDIQDVISIASAWNTLDFDPVLDINRDGIITVADVMLASGNWGASCWE